MLQAVNGRIAPKGWILEHLRRDRDGITGHLDKLCADADCSIFADKKVADIIDGYWSSWWPGETEGNWMIAFIDLAVALGEKPLLDKAAALVNKCLEHQESDGYMGIYLPGERFGAGKRSGELWTQSRLMLAVLSLHRHSGEQRLIDALERMADLTVRQYGPLAGNRSFYETPDEDGSKTHGLMIVEPLLILYEKLGKREYLDFCEFLYQDYSTYETTYPTSDLAMRNALDPNVPLISHGPHTCEQLRIPLLLFAHTGNPVYKAVYTSAAAKIRGVSSLSGSCKSDELIGVFQPQIPEEERVGINLGGCQALPSTGYEYCSTTELVFSYLAGLKLLEDAKYADWEEWMVYNAAMAARRQDGKAIQYLCADNGWDATRKKGDRWDYSPTHIDAAVCCAPNSGKLMPAHLSGMWLQDGRRLYAALYGPCTLTTEVDGTSVTIDEDTSYPFETELRFTLTLDAPQTLALAFRIPNWSRGYCLTLNGETMQPTQKHGAGEVFLEREFRSGDTLLLRFDAEIRYHRAPDGSYALSHGPLLYALDIPAVGDDYFSYEHPGFFDTDYLPAPEAKWAYTLSERGQLTHPDNGGAFPWDSSPLSIETWMLNDWAVPEKVTLVPIGCTLLKRTTFPKLHREDECD